MKSRVRNPHILFQTVHRNITFSNIKSRVRNPQNISKISQEIFICQYDEQSAEPSNISNSALEVYLFPNMKSRVRNPQIFLIVHWNYIYFSI